MPLANIETDVLIKELIKRAEEPENYSILIDKWNQCWIEDTQYDIKIRPC